ncbi:predicted protein [Lichtheimia corymbifera JMRC:FSU:9682]|uniref:Uncharacterized protein n=1 Tax=Lichtheimia corymbifera JMRC:FSU:9682 TaxID=1263082 RepID=A0A068SHK2_9FUNG|nr:predicted protein [Lichtheimia corymbifera JMRC:FSU:9682]
MTLPQQNSLDHLILLKILVPIVTSQKQTRQTMDIKGALPAKQVFAHTRWRGCMVAWQQALVYIQGRQVISFCTWMVYYRDYQRKVWSYMAPFTQALPATGGNVNLCVPLLVSFLCRDFSDWCPFLKDSYLSPVYSTLKWFMHR